MQVSVNRPAPGAISRARNNRWACTSGTLMLCAMNLGLLMAGHHTTGESRTNALTPLPRLVTRWPNGPRSSPAETLLLEARHWRVKAMLVVNQERDTMETWDPHALDVMNQETLRRQLMARDQGGYLRQARLTARRALAVANGSSERYRVTEALACIECESGDHQAELRRARQLVDLAPSDPMAMMVLHRAERCNHLRLSGQ
jgi:hypothetical protein